MKDRFYSEVTMAADNVFDNILRFIQKSFLNYHMQISLFSASIQLKKSLVRDQFGTPILPQNDIESDHHVNELQALK